MDDPKAIQRQRKLIYDLGQVERLSKRERMEVLDALAALLRTAAWISTVLEVANEDD